MEEKARLALAEKKLMSEEKRCRRKTSRSRSPPPPSFFPDYPADGHESGITASDEHVDKMSGCALPAVAVVISRDARAPR